ncbi:MAG: hypothetical protein J2O38_00120 [Acidimicrobiales bacterium]|nr:hypothetical protein [Acidimicrobiales bacterium]
MGPLTEGEEDAEDPPDCWVVDESAEPAGGEVEDDWLWPEYDAAATPAKMPVPARPPTRVKRVRRLRRRRPRFRRSTDSGGGERPAIASMTDILAGRHQALPRTG